MLSRDRFFVTPSTVARHGPLSMEFSRQEYWSGLPFPSPCIFIAAAAKSLQSCPTHRRRPTRLPCLWDSPGKNTAVGCHFLLQCMNVKNQSEVAQLCPTLSDLMDCNLPGSSIHGIFQARVLWCLEHDNYSCVFHKKGLGGGSIHTPLFKLYLLQFIFLSYILLTLKYILLNSIFDLCKTSIWYKI